MTGEFESLYDVIRQSEDKGHAPQKFYEWCLQKEKISRRIHSQAHVEGMHFLSTMPEEQLRAWIFQFLLEDES